MSRVVLLAPLLLLGSALFDSSPAAALLRCGGGIVSASDSLSKVADACGDPDEWSERIVVRRTPGHWCDGVWQRGNPRVVHIEEWVFDFGPNRLVQALTFENGTLVRIESQGFGTGRARDARGVWRERQWVLLPPFASRLRHRDD